MNRSITRAFHLALILICALLCAFPVAAQTDAPQVQPIGFGMTVEETISATAAFDWWQIEATAGDRVDIEIEAYDGLAPVIGVLTSGGTLLERSEDGAPNGTLRLRFEFPESGTFVIVAGRAGLDQGTTTGRYVLRVERVGTPTVIDPAFQEVTFVCEDQEVVTLATVSFHMDASDMTSYRVTVLGESGFAPVIRFLSSAQSTDECLLPRPEDRVRATLSLPDGTQVPSDPTNSNQLVISPNGTDLGEMTVIIGGVDGSSGQYIALLEGLNLQPASDTDMFNVRFGPLPAQSTTLTAYMIQVYDRLDPVVLLDEQSCDDAGARGCDQVAPATGTGIRFETYGNIVGDRFDAGALITDTEPHTLILSSFANRTQGSYALMLVGELPPRSFAD